MSVYTSFNAFKDEFIVLNHKVKIYDCRELLASRYSLAPSTRALGMRLQAGIAIDLTLAITKSDHNLKERTPKT